MNWVHLGDLGHYNGLFLYLSLNIQGKKESGIC